MRSLSCKTNLPCRFKMKLAAVKEGFGLTFGSSSRGDTT